MSAVPHFEKVAHAFLAALAPADAELREVLQRMLEEDHRRQALLDDPRPGARALVGNRAGLAEGRSGAGRR